MQNEEIERGLHIKFVQTFGIKDDDSQNNLNIKKDNEKAIITTMTAV